MSASKGGFSKAMIVVLGALAITLILKMIFANYPEWVEHFYYHGIYRSFRNVWDFIFSKSPIPIFYLWLFFLLIVFILIVRKFFFIKNQKVQSLKILFVLLALHFIWFYWTWGFNYSRISLGQRWEINASVNEDLFLNEFYHQTTIVDSIRKQFKSEIESYSYNSIELENQIRKLVIDFQKENGFLAFEHVRCRNLSLEGILLIWSTSGVYMPFAGEGQLDGGLHKLSKPFTMAHELCHGMGWTHEGDCNFMAYLICIKSPDPFIRYSGELNYWRYLYANASRVNPEEFKQVRSILSKDILNDLKEINEANDRFPEIFPTLRTWFYDWYLKNNGIASGDKSYSEIIRMVINFKEFAKGIPSGKEGRN